MGENKTKGNRFLIELKKRTLLLSLFAVIVFLIVFIVGYNKSVIEARQKIQTNQPVFVGVPEGLNLREEPSFFAGSKEVLPYLSELSVFERDGEWYLVEGNGEMGWVYSKYLTNDKPKEYSVRDLDFNELIHTKEGITTLLEPEFADYNQDGREDVLLTVLTNSHAKQKDFYIYSYENGYILKKLLTINPTVKPELYQEGYRGFCELKFENNTLVLSYPNYQDEDSLCCPKGGVTEKKFYWEDGIFILK